MRILSKIVLLVSLITTMLGACALESDSDGDAGSDSDGDTAYVETGQLQVVLTSPSDVKAIHVDLYQGTDAPDNLVESRILGPKELVTTFTALREDDYYIKTTVVNSDAGDTYDGEGSTYVERDAIHTLYIIPNQALVSADGNTAPTIQAVEVEEPILHHSYLGPTAGDSLYVATVDRNDPITLAVQASDQDGDALVIIWSVKDGPDQSAADVGTIEGAPDGPNMTWFHDTEGKYWVTILVTDGNNAVAGFQFTVYVNRSIEVLEVEQESINTIPTVAIALDPLWAEGFYHAAVADPDGDSVVSVLWTENCAFAGMLDPTSLDVKIHAFRDDVCTASFTACDDQSCNAVQYALDLTCPVWDTYHCYYPEIWCAAYGWECGDGFSDSGRVFSCGTCDDPAFPVCNADQYCEMCTPTDPDPCGTGGYVCGTAVDSCGVIWSCGTCSAPGTTCIDHICSPDADGGVDGGI